MDKRRIAILGGGVGALSTAFALSELDPQGKRYDITLYQLGWRLGGKTANGRNAAHGQRIEEHGLHIWAGFYENAFTILRAALKALDRPAGTPQATIDQAFVRQNQIFVTEPQGDQWLPWPVWFEPDKDESRYPGRDSIFAAPDDVMPTTPVLLRRAFAAVEFNYLYYKEHWKGDPDASAHQVIARLPPAISAQLDALIGGLAAPNLMIVLAKLMLDRLAASPHSEEIRAATMIALDLLLRDVQHELGHADLPIGFRRYLLMIDLTIRITHGIIRNEALRHGLHVLDRFEFEEFLAQAGPLAPNERNMLVESLYDYAFAYRGDGTPALSACAAVQGLLRMFLTYKGGFFYRATAGMGDTICTPIYQLLRARGVKFRFFQEVKRLHPDASGRSIGAIDLVEQVALANGATDYQPLIDVNGLASWPSEPDWSQLADGERLRAEAIDFEDVLGARWTGTPRTLTKGQDFDEVVLGISLGALADICAPLVEARPAWRDLVTKVGTVRTQAFQLWTSCDAAAMGGAYTAPELPPPLPGQPAPQPEKMGPIVTGYSKPFDTYADMSHLLGAESWPLEGGPRSIAYFCSVLSDDAPGEQEAADALVKQNALGWIAERLPTLWPNLVDQGAIDWSKLWCQSEAQGVARFDQQFWQANINPSERYVTSLPGTLQYRLEPGGSGYSNLFLCGDWTKLPDINAGCVEAAAMSGLLAASALSGYPIPVVSGDTLYAKAQFVDYGGWMAMPPAPAVARNASFQSWVLPANPVALQDFVDRTLNRAAGHRRFKPLTSSVFLNKVQTNELGCADPRYAGEGMMAETDIGFWLLLGRYDFGPELLTGYGWFPAYLLVDEPFATACGREVWGFPKFGSSITVSDTPDGPFSAAAVVIDRFAPSATAAMQTLIRATPDAIETKGFLGGIAEGFRHLCGELADDCADCLAEMAEKHALLGNGSLLPHVYFLKQFRAADDPVEACYRQILKGGLTLDKLTSFNFLHGQWTFEFRDCDSLPFVRDLGLGTPQDGIVTLTSHVGFHAIADFSVAPARPIG